MRFSDIIGQRKAVSILQKSILSGNISHGYILSGVEGIGKKSLAAAFAAALFCENLSEGTDSCGICRTCLLTEADSNPDYIIISTEESSIGVEEIREKLQATFLIKPAYSKRKIYLIQEADMMTVQAQNCILKTLEEPPSYCTIILTTSNIDSLIQTVRSRSVHIPLLPCSNDEIIALLGQRVSECKLEPEIVAALSQGIPGKAIEISQDRHYEELREKTVEAVTAILRKKEKAAVEYFSFFNDIKDEHEKVLEIMLGFFRDVLVQKATNTENVLINADKKDIILSCVLRTNQNNIAAKIDIIEETRKQLRHNVNYNLAIETMLLKLGED